jgi:hypothetical protein
MDDPRAQGQRALVKWQKEGLIFSPSGQRPWLRSHASLAVPLHLEGDEYRVYFAARDDENRSHVGYVELNLRSRDLLSVAELPVLEPGPLGHFDDHGVYPASLVTHDKRLYLYYIGWNPGVTAPLFYASIGLAVSDDGGLTFAKISSAPILGRSDYDPCLVTSPFVLLENGIWRMWYVSGFKWERGTDSLESYYDIKYAESPDGMSWTRTGLTCIPLREGERNISRPCVLRDRDRYRMWYATNTGSGYRLGFAESSDGYVWKRLDSEVGIDPSPEGWDSKAQAYPSVFAHGGCEYMLYNGNDFGRTGFGLAVSHTKTGEA